MQFTKALQHSLGWKALNTVLTFFINLLLVRILGAAGSGDFFYSIAWLSFFTLAISWSMEAGITYYGANNVSSIPSIILFSIPWLVLQAIGSWWFLDIITLNIQKHIAWLYVISNLVIIYISALYYAKKMFFSINVIICIVNFIVLISLGWLYSTNNHGAESFFNLLNQKIYNDSSALFQLNTSGNSKNSYHLAGIVYFIGFAIQALVLVFVYLLRLQIIPFVPVNRPTLIRNIFLYSSVAFISNLLFFLVTRVDYFFVEKYCNDIELGNYVQVSKMGQLLVLLPSILAGVVFPFSSGTNDNNFLTKLQMLCRITSLLFVPAAFILVFVGYWLFPWLFGNGFRLMYPSLLLYLPGFYCLSLVALLAAHLAGRAMLNINLMASGLSLILVVTGDVLFVKLGGIYAAAAISSVAYFACLLYLLKVYEKKWGTKASSFIIPGASDLQFLLKNYFSGYPSR